MKKFIKKQRNRKIIEFRYQLNRVLTSFLNGDTLTLPSLILYPLWQKHKSPFTQLSQYLTTKDSQDSTKTLSRREFSVQLSQLYKHLDPLGTGQEIEINIKQTFVEWSKKVNDPFLKPIFLLKQELEKMGEELEGFYLHGSLATLDYSKGFSDTDCILIVKHGVIRDPARLMTLQQKIIRLRKILYLIDPLQHHGFTIVLEEELHCFADLFPVGLLERSVPLIGSKKMLTVRLFRRDKRGRIFQDEQFFRKEAKKVRRSAYDAKFLVSKILLLPSLFLQSIDIECLKKESFDVARPYFTDSEWWPITQASQLRRSWQEQNRFRQILTTLLMHYPNPFWQIILMKLLRTAQISKKEQVELASRAHYLCRLMLEKSERDIRKTALGEE